MTQDQCLDLLQGTPGESEKEFKDYLLSLLAPEGGGKTARAVEPPPWPDSDVSRAARALAAQFIGAARIEALDKLGEHGASAALAEAQVREMWGYGRLPEKARHDGPAQELTHPRLPIRPPVLPVLAACASPGMRAVR